MRSKIIFGGAALAVAAASLVIACSDTPTTLNAISKGGVRATAAASAVRAQIHQRNAHEWVGVAHNKALDDWRREMRKPGVLTHNLCSYVTDFATRDERLPADKRFSLPARRRAIGAAARTSTLCQAKSASSSLPSLASRGHKPSRLRQGSAALSTLQSEIENAVIVAETSYDLAGRLNSVLDAAATLDEVEQTIVSAAVSVAQNSYEYWETEYPAVVQEVANEYGACATERQASGYSMEAARDACLSGEHLDTSFRGLSPSSFLGPTTSPSVGALRRCGPGLSEGFKHVAKSDARGAFGGAWAGAFGAAAGIVGGAILGAAAGSIWAAGENAWTSYWCIMAK